MRLNEPTLADAAPVYTGRAYVADNTVVVSQIGTDDTPATVADLKAALGASVIQQIDLINRSPGWLEDVLGE